MLYDPAKELAELEAEEEKLEEALAAAITAGDKTLQGYYYRTIAANQNAQVVAMRAIADAQRTRAYVAGRAFFKHDFCQGVTLAVNDDDCQGMELTVNVHSFDDADASCETKVTYDARCCVAMVLSEEDFDLAAATLKLSVRSCDELVGGFKATQRVFANVALPHIEASADFAIYRGGPGGISLFGRPLMELMGIRCNPDKTVSKCKTSKELALRAKSPATGEQPPGRIRSPQGRG